MTTTVEQYLTEGCGRCHLGGTPDCKVHQWIAELESLRKIVLDCGLTEEVKWGVPCYTFQNKNVLLLSAFRNHCAISFFKGVLMSDPNRILEKPGANSQSDRLIKFTNINAIKEIQDDLKSYIYQAIEIEKTGLKVKLEKNPEPIPEELERKFEEDLVLKAAFEALTPGRQKGYIIYFSAPKQSKTRISRIDKCVGKILNGEGLHDKYSRKK